MLNVLIGLVLVVFAGMLAIDLASLFRKKEAAPKKSMAYTPKALVIVPCKGRDPELRKNLLSIKKQAYRKFGIVAVVDSKNDYAVGEIKKAGLHYLISSAVCNRCSGKVRAIATALERYKEFDAYVIADSDIRVRRHWLRELLLPLSDSTVGISTMYPYFKPVNGFWSSVKSVWGMAGEGLMKSDLTKFGWGGSIAFRKELISSKTKMDFFKESEYSVSDDICLTMLARQKGLGIAYTDSLQPVVSSDDDLQRFWEWANRQTALSILGNRKNLYIGIPFYLSESILIVSGILLPIFVSPLFLILLLHYLKSIALTYTRSESKDPLIIPITLLMPFLYMANLAIASRMTEISWRGSRYPLQQRAANQRKKL